MHKITAIHAWRLSLNILQHWTYTKTLFSLQLLTLLSLLTYEIVQYTNNQTKPAMLFMLCCFRDNPKMNTPKNGLINREGQKDTKKNKSWGYLTNERRVQYSMHFKKLSKKKQWKWEITEPPNISAWWKQTYKILDIDMDINVEREIRYK